MWSWTWMWASVRRAKGKEFEKTGKQEGREPAVLPSVPGLPHLGSLVI